MALCFKVDSLFSGVSNCLAFYLVVTQVMQHQLTSPGFQTHHQVFSQFLLGDRTLYAGSTSAAPGPPHPLSWAGSSFLVPLLFLVKDTFQQLP